MAHFEKKYEVKMKPGTAGTIDDPHRPLIADIPMDEGSSWGMDGSAHVKVRASSKNHKLIAKTHREVTP